MPVTSFTKNFAISRQNAKAFTKLMTDPAKPLLPHSFRSSFVHLGQHLLLDREIREAMHRYYS